MEFPHGRSMHARLFGLDISGGDDIDPDPMTTSASKVKTSTDGVSKGTRRRNEWRRMDSRSPLGSEVLGQARDGRLGRVVKDLPHMPPMSGKVHRARKRTDAPDSHASKARSKRTDCKSESSSRR